MRRKAEIAFFEEEDFVVVGQQNPNPDIELPLVYQHWAFYVLLNNEGKHSKVACLLL
jgi:hypothetical protein